MSDRKHWVYPEGMLQACQFCEDQFKVTKNQFRQGRKFCSWDCYLKDKEKAHAELKVNRKCANDDCDRTDVVSRGLCNACYQFWRLHFTKTKKYAEKICPGCNKAFSTNNDRKFCSQECYLKSDTWASNMIRIADRNASLRVDRKCLQCSETMSLRPHEQGSSQCPSTGKNRDRRFCNRRCYRKYFADRFDRMVAESSLLEVPCSYDEFLDQDELPCMIAGCEWKGKHLSMHCSHYHGIAAAELKALLGFNRTTGLIVQETFDRLSASDAAQRAKPDYVPHLPVSDAESIRRKRGPIRAEGIEHFKKDRALRKIVKSDSAENDDRAGRETH